MYIKQLHNIKKGFLHDELFLYKSKIQKPIKISQSFLYVKPSIHRDIEKICHQHLGNVETEKGSHKIRTTNDH